MYWRSASCWASILTIVFYRLRRPKPPQTSFYQPVRIKNVRLQFAGLMAGAGQVGFMKLAFTNPDYLNVFVDANQEAIKAKRIAVVKSLTRATRKPRHLHAIAALTIARIRASMLRTFRSENAHGCASN